MKSKLIVIFALAVLLLSFVESEIVELSYPSYFPEVVYPLEENPLTKEKIELGRALFYDPILSADNSVSCASCHSPYNAFAHTDHELSHGIHDSIGTRNAPALFNLAWSQSFMWDGAIHHLDMQALAPIESPSELGSSLDSVLTRLNSSSLYKDLSMQAYGDSTLTTPKFLKAMSQFQLTLISDNSKYDQVQQGQAVFSEMEEKGLELFKNNCVSCHTEPLFTSGAFANNGLAVDTTLHDQGRKTASTLDEDLYKFKIPSLRNLEYTKPYMHDGRFETLSEVLDHYTQGIHDSPTLDDKLKESITLSSAERVELTAFLLTLSDRKFVFNPKHQYPRELLLKNYK